MEQTFVTNRATLADAIATAQGEQVTELVAAAEAAAGDASALATIAAKPINADLIAGYLRSTALAGVEAARLEHANQVGSAEPLAAAGGGTVDEADLERRVRGRAEATAATLAQGLNLSASRQASRVSTLDAAGTGAAVRDHLEGLSGSYVDLEAGGATQSAYNAGRFAYFSIAKPKELYASEILDANTCGPCGSVDGTEYASIQDAEADYPTGGFIECEGMERCRGTCVGVYY
jgi:hypothetical protein